MKKVQHKDIDNIFKHVLEDPVNETGFREDDWDAFEQLLDKGKKPRRIVYWLPVLSSVAALALLVLGWWTFRPQVAEQNNKTEQQVVAAQPQKIQPSGVNGEAGKDKTAQSPVPPTVADKPLAEQAGKTGYAAENTIAKRHQAVSKPAMAQATNAVQKDNNVVNQEVVIPNNSNAVSNRDYIALAKPAKKGINPAIINDMPVLASVNILPKPTVGDLDGPVAGKGPVKKGGSSFRPQFALSVLGSSDINGASTFKNSSTGTNIGLMFSVQVKKFTITTGGTYSIKPYTLPFSSYSPNSTYKFKNSPETVTADCRMLDIPLNIDYQVYNKNRNKLSVGTGLSSYLMTHENYTYNYSNPGVAGPASYAVKSPAQYLFSIVNLQATYQRQVTSKIGISVQPYLKLPLKEIGYSEVKLQTIGVAVGLNWNINSLTKPK